MRRIIVALSFSCLLLVSTSFAADEPAAPTQAELEAKFAETMSNSIMKGSFTMGEMKPGEPLKEDKYTLGEVKKLDNGKWVFNTRIQYGEHDVTVPLMLDVVWAGDTPVITLTKFPVPGLGTFTARVLVYDDQYAGTWDGGDHGGHLFGVIERPKDEKPSGKKAADAPEKAE
jgi:hypothetical protein